MNVLVFLSNKRHLFALTLILLSSLLLGQYSRGVLPEMEDKEYGTLPQRAPLVSRSYTAVPAAKSLRQYAPLPRNQGVFGNCTGWASAYCARTILAAKQNGWADVATITNNAFSPGLTFRLGGGQKDKCTGAFTTVVVRSLATHGVIKESDLMGTSTSNECPQFPLQQSVLAKIPGTKIPFPLTLWQPDFDNEKAKIERVKRALAADHPVVISMVAPKSFEGADTGGSVGSLGLWTPETPYPQPYDKARNCHAVTVIGYNDDRFGGTFEIMNSWGTKWGDGGFGYIRYVDFARFAYQGFELFLEPAQEAAGSPVAASLAGELRLFDVQQAKDLPVKLAKKTRNWTVGGNKGGYTYEIDQPLRRGIEMRIYLESEQPAYVYLLGTGSEDPGVAQLFPQPGFSAAMNYNDYEVALPNEDQYLVDNSVGTNFLLLLYSQKALDIEDILDRLNRDKTKPISERLNKEIRSLLIDADDITFATDKIAFDAALTDGKQAFAMIIKSTHVE